MTECPITPADTNTQVHFAQASIQVGCDLPACFQLFTQMQQSSYLGMRHLQSQRSCACPRSPHLQEPLAAALLSAPSQLLPQPPLALQLALLPAPSRHLGSGEIPDLQLTETHERPWQTDLAPKRLRRWVPLKKGDRVQGGVSHSSYDTTWAPHSL